VAVDGTARTFSSNRRVPDAGMHERRPGLPYTLYEIDLEAAGRRIHEDLESNNVKNIGRNYDDVSII